VVQFTLSHQASNTSPDTLKIWSKKE
jgi:hypothetical protein